MTGMGVSKRDVNWKGHPLGRDLQWQGKGELTNGCYCFGEKCSLPLNCMGLNFTHPFMHECRLFQLQMLCAV